MQNWQHIVKLALVGTERGNFTEETKAELASLGLKTDQEPTAIVLEGAAAYASMQKAGFKPKEYKKELPSKAEIETLPTCSTRSAQHLTLMLKGTHKEAFNEFIDALALIGKRIPENNLPDMLEMTRTKPELWEKLYKIGGKRGEWLIQMNDRWKHSVTIPDISAWEVGKKEERIALLKHLRVTNPMEAMELLSSTWQEESTYNRKSFIKIIDEQVSSADESYLEAFLDNSKKEERKIIGTTLSKIPNAAIVERMFSFLKPLITITETQKLELELPNKVEEEMVRDGIDPRSQWFRGGIKASRFGQIFTLIPLDKWISILGSKPLVVFQRFIKSDWAELLIQASIESAILHKSEAWKAVILNHWVQNQEAVYWKNLNNLDKLVKSASKEVFNDIAISGFRRSTALLEENHPIVVMMKNSDHLWMQKLTVEFVDHLRTWLNKETSKYWSGWHFRAILKKAGYKSSPYLHGRFVNGWPEESRIWSNWEKEVAHFLSALQFRKNMLEELKK